MKKISDFLSKKFLFLEVKISIYLNRRVFVMVMTECSTRRKKEIYRDDIFYISSTCNAKLSQHIPKDKFDQDTEHVFIYFLCQYVFLQKYAVWSIFVVPVQGFCKLEAMNRKDLKHLVWHLFIISVIYRMLYRIGILLADQTCLK